MKFKVVETTVKTHVIVAQMGVLVGGGILIGSAPLTDGSTRIGEFVVGGTAMILAVIAVIYQVTMIALLWMKEPNHLIRLLVDFFLNLVVGIIAAGGVMLDLILAIIEPASVIIWVAFGLFSVFALALITVAISSAIIRSKLKKEASSDDIETPDEFDQEPSAPPATHQTPTVYTFPNNVAQRSHAYQQQNYVIVVNNPAGPGNLVGYPAGPAGNLDTGMRTSMSYVEHQSDNPPSYDSVVTQTSSVQVSAASGNQECQKNRV